MSNIWRFTGKVAERKPGRRAMRSKSRPTKLDEFKSFIIPGTCSLAFGYFGTELLFKYGGGPFRVIRDFEKEIERRKLAGEFVPRGTKMKGEQLSRARKD